MKQMTLATAGFERYAKTTRRASFLAQMERVVPWRRLSLPKIGSDNMHDGVRRGSAGQRAGRAAG